MSDPTDASAEPDLDGRRRPDLVLSRIYTRTGDGGTTALGDMTRVAKTDARIVAYADVDETNSAIGVALALGQLDADVAALLTSVQNDLFDVGADVCTPVVTEPVYSPLRVTDAYVTRLESACDAYNERLSTLRSFVLPGGTPGAALLHVARTLARRAERSAWALLATHPDDTSVVPARYLNRLSDLLFILARVANHAAGDVLWRPGGSVADPASSPAAEPGDPPSPAADPPTDPA